MTTLDTDFGGDNIVDVKGDGGNENVWLQNRSAITYAKAGGYAGLLASAWLRGDSMVMIVSGGPVAIRSGMVAFSLVDSVVRGGSPTAGWLDVTATGRPSGEFGRVDVHRFVFDDTTGLAPGGVAHADAAYPEYVAVAVPEPSGLGLLALGAGGLLARRRRAMAA